MSWEPSHAELIEFGFEDLGDGVYAQRVPHGVDVYWMRDPDQEGEAGYQKMQARLDAWLAT